MVLIAVDGDVAVLQARGRETVGDTGAHLLDRLAAQRLCLADLRGRATAGALGGRRRVATSSSCVALGALLGDDLAPELAHGHELLGEALFIERLGWVPVAGAAFAEPMLFGALIVGVFTLGLRLMGADAQWTYLLIGLLIIAAVTVDQWIRKVSV